MNSSDKTIDIAYWKQKVVREGYSASMEFSRHIAGVNMSLDVAKSVLMLAYDLGAWVIGLELTEKLTPHIPALIASIWKARFSLECGQLDTIQTYLTPVLNNPDLAGVARYIQVQQGLIQEQSISWNEDYPKIGWDAGSCIRLFLSKKQKEEAQTYLSLLGDDFDFTEKKLLEALVAFAFNPQAAIPKIHTALANRPGQANLWSMLALAIEKEDSLKALEYLENAYQFRPWWQAPMREAIRIATQNALHMRAVPWAARLIECANNAQDVALAADAMQNVNRISTARLYLEQGLKRWPSDLGLIFQQAVVDHGCGLLEEAVLGYEKVLNEHPNHQGALANMAAAAQMRGDYSRAELAYMQLAQTESNKIEWLLALASIFKARLDFASAEAYYKQILKLDASYFQALDGLVSLMLMSGKSQHALVFSRRAYESMPNDPRRLLLYIRLLKENGSLDIARAELEKAFKKTKERFALWCEWIDARFAINPATLEADLALGVAWAEKHDARFHLIAGQKLAALGKLTEAETYFYEAYKRDPLNTLPILGEFEIQRGQRDAARSALREYQTLDPQNPAPALSLVRMTTREGDIATAEKLLAQLEEKYPLNENIINEKIALLWRTNKPAEALEIAEHFRSMTGTPNSYEAVIGAAEKLGDSAIYQQAIEQYLENYPENDNALKFAAQRCFALGDTVLGIKYLNRRVNLKPDSVIAKLDKIRVYFALGEYDQARAESDILLNQYRNYPASCIPLVQVAIELGDYQTAQAHIDTLIKLLPSNSNVHLLGIELASRIPNDPWVERFKQLAVTQISDHDRREDFEIGILTRLGQGRAALEKAKLWQTQRPATLSSHQAVLSTLVLLEMWGDVLVECEQILAQFPFHMRIQLLRAQAYEKQKLFSKAEADYKDILSRDANNRAAEMALLQLYSQIGEWTLWDKIFQRLSNKLGSKLDSTLVSFFFGLIYHPGEYGEHILDYYRRWGKTVEFNRPVFRRKAAVAKERIHIGYVSGDFRQHAMFSLIESLLSQHDRERYRIIAYATHPPVLSDKCTDQLKEWVDVYHQTDQWSLEEFRKHIEEDDIDMLIDLAQHTSHNRIQLFTRRVVAVQVGFQWAHMQSSGLECFDALIVDPLNCDESGLALVTEHVEYAPGVGTVLTSGSNELTAAEKIPFDDNGYITYLFPMRPHRINDRLIRCWSEILKRVPNARLRLDHPSFIEPDYQQRLTERLERLGIPTERFWLGNTRPYSQVFAEADIVLDSFPANGATVVRDALLCGAPVVNLRSRPLMGRAGTGYLMALGLDDWSAGTEQEYIDIAVKKASAIAELRELRLTLPKTITSTTACQPEFMAQSVMQAYERIWANACRRDEASHLLEENKLK